MSGIYSAWGAGAQSAGVKIDIDNSILLKNLNLLAAADARKFAGVRREIGEYMLGNVQDNFDGQRLFDGSPMPQSKAAQGRTTTWKRSNKKLGRVKGAERASGKTLIAAHHLYDSYVYQLTSAGVEIGAALIYAAIHHFGGDTGRPGHRFEMTARPVLGVSTKQEMMLGELVIAELRSLQ
jgi:phage gpG-like protein